MMHSSKKLKSKGISKPRANRDPSIAIPPQMSVETPSLITSPMQDLDCDEDDLALPNDDVWTKMLKHSALFQLPFDTKSLGNGIDSFSKDVFSVSTGEVRLDKSKSKQPAGSSNWCGTSLTGVSKS